MGFWGSWLRGGEFSFADGEAGAFGGFGGGFGDFAGAFAGGGGLGFLGGGFLGGEEAFGEKVFDGLGAACMASAAGGGLFDFEEERTRAAGTLLGSCSKMRWEISTWSWTELGVES